MMGMKAFFLGLAYGSRLHPRAVRGLRRADIVRDVIYADDGVGCHKLDIYRPTEQPPPWPVVLYVHGGGFTMLSKDTHWLMGLAFAHRGYVVFNVDYRLAPRHPFPAGLNDVCTAYAWVARNARSWGGDPDKLVLAGESAGANLVTALAVCACFDRPEPFAREVASSGLRPRVVLPACGLLQVSDVERFGRRRPLSVFAMDRLVGVQRAYLGSALAGGPKGLELADPLCVLEGDEQPCHPLPPFFVPVGTADPLLDDTRRLAAALERRGVTCEARYYEGEVHAFHALVFRRRARQCWADMFAFTSTHLGGA
jgi:acetyl esterase